MNATALSSFRHTIEALPEKQPAAVLLHKYEEMDYSEIARVLDCLESALKSLLFRAYETLRAGTLHAEQRAIQNLPPGRQQQVRQNLQKWEQSNAGSEECFA